MTRTNRNGRIVPLATHYQGKQLNSPNDIVCASDGGIYFTDPPYGRLPYYGVPREQELPIQGVYRVGDDPLTPALLADGFELPNGLCSRGDGSRLLVNDTARQHIRVFDVRSDGGLAGGKVWAETRGEGKGVPDGEDRLGRQRVPLWTRRTDVFDPQGVTLGDRSARVRRQLRLG